MQNRKSLYGVLENELLAIKELSCKYLNIFEKDIIDESSIFFSLCTDRDYLYLKLRDYFFFAVIPSIEIIDKKVEAKQKYEKELIKLQTLLGINERFIDNIVDKQSRYIQDDLILYAYTFHEAVNLLIGKLQYLTEVPIDDFLKKYKEIIKAGDFKIFSNPKISIDKADAEIVKYANVLWKKASSIFIIPSFMDTSQKRLRALESYISANILLDDLLDMFEDYKHNRETLPLLLWRVYSEEMSFNKHATDFVIKESVSLIKNLLDKSIKIFREERLEYSEQVAKILKEKYCEWFPEHI